MKRLIHFLTGRMKNLSLFTPVYSLTLLLSAALLFSVQPMFSKMILPLLGGTPQVWNTAMLFFQVMLLGGYAYAHGTSKYLSVRTQAIVHLILLAVFIAVLPFGIPPGWTPPVDHDPTLWQLSLMAATVGGPFFVLAGSAPMLQRWFSGTKHPDADNPYFLYGASNLGSMTALLAYPTIIEPLLTLSGQAVAWEVGYAGLICFTLFSALLVRDQFARPKKTKVKIETVTWEQRIQWLILAFIPSSLMLGVTTFITTDIAAVPLLWIIPLALYVGTFIIVFARQPLVSKRLVLNVQGVLLALLLVKMVGQFNINPAHLILLHLSLFFTCALACHMELAASRPGVSRLTEFYLIMSIGGALGGFFNAIIAPVYFIIPVEYSLALVAAVFMRYATEDKQSFHASFARLKKLWKSRGLDSVFTLPFMMGFIVVFATFASFSIEHSFMCRLSGVAAGIALLFLFEKRWAFAALTAFALFFFPPGYIWGNHIFTNMIHRDRNFFGVIKVADTRSGERMLLHGTTNHGAQPLDPKLRLTPLSYYSTFSPVNDAFAWLNRSPGRQNVAVVGLGIGVTACFKKPGRHFDFFEIDPAIVRIAENTKYFTYLSDCKSPYNIILGDGRLTMSDKPDHSYDMILLDAFSSDNIPAHLLTKEAVELYMKKLKPGGVLIFNVSNNYLDIEPVLARTAEALRVPGYARATLDGKIKGTDLTYYAAHFFSMSANPSYIRYLRAHGWSEARERAGVKLWTDQFSNIVSVLENRTVAERLRAAAKARDEAEKKTKKK